MDLGTVITAIVIILVCIIPFMVMNSSYRKRKNHFFKSLSQLARANDSAISQYDVWSSWAIGLDRAANAVYFVRKFNSYEICQFINTVEIQKCHLVNTPRSVSIENGDIKMIGRLELAMACRDKNRSEIILEFYNAEHDGLTLTGELHLAEKWCKIINDNLGALAEKGNKARKGIAP